MQPFPHDKWSNSADWHSTLSQFSPVADYSNILLYANIIERGYMLRYIMHCMHVSACTPVLCIRTLCMQWMHAVHRTHYVLFSDIHSQIFVLFDLFSSSFVKYANGKWVQLFTYNFRQNVQCTERGRKSETTEMKN